MSGLVILAASGFEISCEKNRHIPTTAVGVGRFSGTEFQNGGCSRKALLACSHYCTHYSVLPSEPRMCKLTHVRPPRPIEVKKLMENRVFLGLSRGNNPSKYGCNVLQQTQ